jgi:hypothetical protein
VDAPLDLVERSCEHRPTDLEMVAIEQIASDDVDREPPMDLPTHPHVGGEVGVDGLLKPGEPADESTGDVYVHAARQVE